VRIGRRSRGVQPRSSGCALDRLAFLAREAAILLHGMWALLETIQVVVSGGVGGIGTMNRRSMLVASIRGGVGHTSRCRTQII
jgi:hypothetical protein